MVQNNGSIEATMVDCRQGLSCLDGQEISVATDEEWSLCTVTEALLLMLGEVLNQCVVVEYHCIPIHSGLESGATLIARGWEGEGEGRRGSLR